MRVVPVETLIRELDVAAAGGVPRVVVAGNCATPWIALDAVDRALASYRLFMLNAGNGIPARDGVTWETPFVGPGMRGAAALAYYPSRLSLVPSLLRNRIPPDIVVIQVAPPRDGVVSLGIEVNILPAAIEAVRDRGGLVVAQINRSMPFTRGEAVLPVAYVDVAIEADAPVDERAGVCTADLQAAIGDLVVSLVADGATLQLGIGGIPDAMLGRLRGRRQLRVWSEMISDGVMSLHRSGSVADHPMTASFAAGTRELYAWLDGNPNVRFGRTERVNDPAAIARQHAMTSVNAALEVDLYVQANASYVGGRIHSGFGGQSDFVVGALHSDGGQAIVALPSWWEKGNASTIVPMLVGPATSFQHSCVVTDQGIARIWGMSQRDQAIELIDRAADPRARDALREQVDLLF